MSLTSDRICGLTSHKNLTTQASNSLTGSAPSIKLSADRDLAATTGGGATFKAATAYTGDGAGYQCEDQRREPDQRRRTDDPLSATATRSARPPA